MIETGIREDIIHTFKKVFASYPEIEKVKLYGSRAKGNFKEGSDIDLVIIAPQFTLTEINKMENRLDDLMLPWKIDIVLQHQIENTDLLDHIRRVGITIYEK